MGLARDIRTVTDLKSHAAELLAQVNRDRRPLIITQKGRARAVVLDPESYERMETAIGLLKLLAQGEQAARERKTLDHDTLFNRLEKKYGVRIRHGRTPA